MKKTRAKILAWGPEALTWLISNNFPCMEVFFKAWLDVKTIMMLSTMFKAKR